MSVREFLARNARTPHVAGLLVATTAAVFTPLWLFVLIALDGGAVHGESPFLMGFFLLVTPVNAYVVTRLAWGRWVAGRAVLRPGRAAVVGAVIGVVSFLTLTAALFLTGHLVGAVSDPPTVAALLDVPGFFGGLVQFTLLAAAIGLFATWGVPVVLSVGVALLLSRLDRDRRDGHGRTRRPKEHVRPPR